MPAFAIETRGLSKKYGSFLALDSLDLRIEPGIVQGLLGPNGAGKTTAIKILCGLIRASGGQAYVLGKKVPDRSVLPRMGYMPQEIALYPDLTVHGNLTLYGRLYGLPGDGIARREGELLDFVALTAWRDSLVSNLSGGMKHRLSLACSMIHDPQLLFLDEPTVGVDPELRASFWEYFGHLKQRGVTIVLTTHYMDEAGHCDRIALLRQGRLLAEGPPAEVVRSAGVASLEEAFLALAGRQDGRR